MCGCSDWPVIRTICFLLTAISFKLRQRISFRVRVYAYGVYPMLLLPQYCAVLYIAALLRSMHACVVVVCVRMISLLSADIRSVGG